MPRRHDQSFTRIANFQALHAASRRAIRGKRKKPSAAAFFANLERELVALERQLLSGEYRPGRYVAFEVNDPKRRIVSAAPFRDRVVHHALCAVVEPIFEDGFIDHTFANRTGKGTHRAIEVYERYRDRYAYVLRCDIYRYFPAIARSGPRRPRYRGGAGRLVPREPIRSLRHGRQRLGVDGGLLERELPRRAGRRLRMDKRRLQSPRSSAAVPGSTIQTASARRSATGALLRRPGRQPRFPGRPDAYPLNLDLFTCWGPGAKPLVEFFAGVARWRTIRKRRPLPFGELAR